MYETTIVVIILIGMALCFFRLTLGAFIVLFTFFGGGALVVTDLVDKICS